MQATKHVGDVILQRIHLELGACGRNSKRLFDINKTIYIRWRDESVRRHVLHYVI